MSQPTTTGNSYQFSIGHIYAAPKSGLLAVDPTPQEFGVIQGASVDFKQEVKTLFGNRKSAVDAAHGMMKITGKVDFANINTTLFNNLLFAGTSSAGTHQYTSDEATTLASTTYQVTNHATYIADYGVFYATSAGLQGTPLVAVPSAPTTGQYSVAVSTGTYTFAAGDNGNNILVNYSWTDSGVGTTLQYTNQLMGPAPRVEVVLVIDYSQSFILPGNALRLPACIFSDLSFPLKNDDYVKMSMSFEAFQDPNGILFEWYQVAS